MAFASRVRFYCPLPLTLFREKTALRQQNTAVPPLLHPGATRTRAGCAYHPHTTRPVRVLKCPGRFCLFSTLTEYSIRSTPWLLLGYSVKVENKRVLQVRTYLVLYLCFDPRLRCRCSCHDRIMLGGHFPDRVRCDTWSVDSIPLLNIGKRSTQEELHRVSGDVRSTAAA